VHRCAIIAPRRGLDLAVRTPDGDRGDGEGEGSVVLREQLEIEHKFDVPASFSLPDLTGLPGVASVDAPEERSLEAVYYDTADLRLLRAPVTVRRRTGGPDAGWHLKLPAGDGARRELHFPLGRAGRTPPRAVLAPVRGLVRTAGIDPVARVHTRRVATLLRDEAGRVLVEVADDTVTGTAFSPEPGEPATVTSWREIEVELVDGDPQLMAAVGERLHAAGARPSASASKLGRVLADRLVPPRASRPEPAQEPGTKGRKKADKAGQPSAASVALASVGEQVRALQAADVLVRTNHPDGVHDLRVACRRLRSILASFRPVLDRAVTDPLRDGLRWLGSELSEHRDDQVALAHLRALAEAQPPELLLGPVAARLQQAQIRGAEAGRKAGERTLGDTRYFALLDGLFGLLDDPPLTALAEAPAAEVLASAVRRAGRRLRHALDSAYGDPSDEHLHGVRKATKRLRYTAELAAPVLGKGTRTLVDRMAEVQDILGERQDTVVTRERCRELGLAAHAAGENAWTFGLLYGLEQGRAERAERLFWEVASSLPRVVRKGARKH
jgi:CHAD domain-containing protein